MNEIFAIVLPVTELGVVVPTDIKMPLNTFEKPVPPIVNLLVVTTAFGLSPPILLFFTAKLFPLELLICIAL